MLTVSAAAVVVHTQAMVNYVRNLWPMRVWSRAYRATFAVFLSAVQAAPCL